MEALAHRGVCLLLEFFPDHGPVPDRLRERSAAGTLGRAASIAAVDRPVPRAPRWNRALDLLAQLLDGERALAETHDILPRTRQQLGQGAIGVSGRAALLEGDRRPVEIVARPACQAE